MAGNKARRGSGVPAPTVDESLKYKFFTIAVGIIILGFGFHITSCTKLDYKARYIQIECLKKA